MLTRDYIEYNMWANNRVHKMIKNLSEEQFNKGIISSFPSIKETLHHIIAVEIIWEQRIIGNSLKVFPQLPEGKKEALIALLNSLYKLKETIKSQTDEMLLSLITFKDTEGHSHSFTGEEIIQHCINHSTYHRGQLMTMFRQLGVSSIEGLDYITYLWMKKTSV